MKKKLFVGLVTVIMMFSLMVSPVLAATSYDAFAQYDSTSAIGENVPWGYNVTTDGGATFTPCTIYEANGIYLPWHPVAGVYTGVGTNGDVPDFMELNSDGNGTDGALSFIAPEDGTYTFSINAKNPWEQPADVLHASLNGTDLFTVELSVGDAAPTVFEQTGVALNAGDQVYFYCPSTTAGGWVSAYLQAVVTLEDATEDTTATDTAATTDVPKTGVVGLGLLFGAGAVITGAFSLKRKSK